MAADQISIFCVDAGVSSSVKSVFFSSLSTTNLSLNGSVFVNRLNYLMKVGKYCIGSQSSQRITEAVDPSGGYTLLSG